MLEVMLGNPTLPLSRFVDFAWPLHLKIRMSTEMSDITSVARVSGAIMDELAKSILLPRFSLSLAYDIAQVAV